MLFHRIRVETYRKFDRPIDVPFVHPISLIIGENEAGKSTLIDCIRDVLFRKYNSSDNVIQAMLPYKINDNPKITLEFSHNHLQYTLVKHFGKEATLKSSDGKTHKNKYIEKPLSQLFSYTKPSSTKLDIGLWKLFWYEQNPPSEPLSIEKSVFEKTAFEEETQKFLLTASERTILESIKTEYNRFFTPKHQLKQHYKKERDQEQQYQKKLQEYQKEEQEYQDTLQSYRQCSRNLMDFNQELQKLTAEIYPIQEKLQQLSHKIQHIKDRQQQQQTLQYLKDTQEQRQCLIAEVLQAEQDYQTSQQAFLQAQTEAYLAIKQKQHLLEEKHQKAQNFQSQLNAIQDKIRTLSITPQIWQDLKRCYQDYQKKLFARDAVATEIECHVSEDLEIRCQGEHLADKKRLLSHKTVLTLGVYGTLTITPGGQYFEHYKQHYNAAQKKLQSVLTDSKFETIQAAKQAFEHLQQYETEKEKLLYSIRSLPSISELEKELTMLQQRIQSCFPRLESSELHHDTQCFKDTLQEHQEQKYLSAERNLRERETERDFQYNLYQHLLQKLKDARQKQSDEDLKTQREHLQHALDTLNTHGVEDSEHARQYDSEKHALEKHLSALEEKKSALEEQHKHHSIQQAMDEVRIQAWKQKESAFEDLKRTYQSIGQKLQRDTQEQEKLKLLYNTMITEEKAYKPDFKGLLQDKAQSYLDLLFKKHVPPHPLHAELQIHIPEERKEKAEIIQIIPELKRSFGTLEREYREKPSQLSQGTREQISVIVRLAYANLLVHYNQPAVVILDDPFVNTDSIRLERMLDILKQASQKVQIILLTCHLDLYTSLDTEPIFLSQCYSS